MKKIGIWSVVFLLAAGCSPDRKFEQAVKAEKNGSSYKAWTLYQQFAANYPKHPKAPEALFRAGWLAQKEQNDCFMAGAFYEEVLDKYPQSDPWAKLAAHQKNNCPDYYPLMPGAQWVEGDSETLGKHARIEVVCKALSAKDGPYPSGSGILNRTYFAGPKEFQSTHFIYKKTESELLEYVSEDDPRPKIILKWPLDVGTRWRTKIGERLFNYEIMAIDKKVKVAAGEFDHCLLVRSSIEGLAGATLEYYAPAIGRVLTAFATDQGEKRNTELLSYQPSESTGFSPTGEKP